MEEYVILVDEQDQMIGTMEKMEAHRKAVLHRAFSVFIFNQKGEMLLQQRALSKYHSAGLWTNACCSHQREAESTLEAAYRRLPEEMGFTTTLTPAFSFIYKAPFDNGLTEHELDHVLLGYYHGEIQPNPAEVMDYTYRTMDAIETDLTLHPQKYTAWFRIVFPQVKDFLAKQPLPAKTEQV